MSAVNNGGPAFPTSEGPGDPWDKGHCEASTGMTLRDYFATRVMEAEYTLYWQSVASMEADGKTVSLPKEWENGIAKAAYKVADAMLRARGDK